MSPQDKVERVLKEIHVAFSKSETYNGHPDKVIIDRKQFLNLLDRLNQGIYDMMDQYEQTRGFDYVFVNGTESKTNVVKKGMKSLRRPMQTRRMCMLHLSFIRQI